MLALAGSALAEERALVRWRPGSGVAAAGFRVWVRPVEATADRPPRNVGAATRAPDGTVEYVLEGLDPRVGYAISVSAYGPKGEESARSNELTLPARPGACAFQADGTACDAADPCIPGSCRAGECVPGRRTRPAPGTALAARVGTSRRLLLGVGSFVTLGAVDPQRDGATLEILGADGAVLHRIEVAPYAFRVHRRGRLFRHVAPWPAAGGLRRLVLRREGDVLGVRLRARADGPLTNAVQPLSWIVRVGSVCVRQLDLRCRARGSRVDCR